MNNSILNNFLVRMETHAQPHSAPQMAAYMKGRFAFLGVNATGRKDALKLLYIPLKGQSYSDIIEFCKALYLLPQREYHQAAIDILNKFVQLAQPNHMSSLEFFLTTHSWWDTIDMLASNGLGIFIKKYPEVGIPWVHKAILSPNFWLNRSAIIHQLKYKNEVNIQLLEESILPHLEHKEFFVQKAIGWSLRQYSRQNPGYVAGFVEQYNLQGLARREALRLLKA
jgi:3-methyladenine DNA glycosylase AlkD